MSPCCFISAWISRMNFDRSTPSDEIGFSGYAGVPKMNFTVKRCFGKSGRTTWRYLT